MRHEQTGTRLPLYRREGWNTGGGAAELAVTKFVSGHASGAPAVHHHQPVGCRNRPRRPRLDSVPLPPHHH